VSTPSRKSAATSLLCRGPGKPGAGIPHAGFYLGGEVQGQPRPLPTDHAISHEWLLTHIPMDKVILRKWLKAGSMERNVLHPTEAGTPQGGICARRSA
jgi:hypothetical protein